LPESSSPWNNPAVVEGFVKSPPNARLLAYAQAARRGEEPLRILDIGCGAGRNAIPLAETGGRVFGIDQSQPMLDALVTRMAGRTLPLRVARAAMDHLPVRQRCIDLVIAHGVWNLAQSDGEFRAAVREAARVLPPGGAVFVFTFSRNTLSASTRPVPGESFIFTEFSGQRQCFLTLDQLVVEMSAAGLIADPGEPIVEHNRRDAGALVALRTPVIHEGIFEKTR
jgi:SAM-dependent methyltransferase